MRPTLAIYGVQDRISGQFPGYVHDHSLALMRGGEVIKYAQLERITLRKHDNRMHIHIEELIESGKLDLPENFEVVFVDSFVGRAFISQSGKIRFEAPLSQKLNLTPEKGVCWWYDRQIDGYALNHELAHLYSCIPFYGMFHENSLLIHFDGGASQSNFSAWLYRNGKLESIEYHWGFSHLSKYFNDNALNFAILGMQQHEHTSVPGKLMGYAAYGTPSPTILRWLKDNGYFRDIWGDYTPFFTSSREKFNWENETFSTEDRFLQNIAATFQDDFRAQFTVKVANLQELLQCDYLYLTGGCALNIVTNTALVDSGLFKEVFIPPCCNDTGLALGAATLMEIQKGNQIAVHGSYLNNLGLDDYQSKFDIETIKEVGELLRQNKIIGVYNGYGEIGPRALGNRSIVARPDSVHIRDRVSQECKQREWYRPIAPIALKQNVTRLTGRNKIPLIARYMLMDFAILPQFRSQLEGVVHVNGTSRMQCLEKRADNPFMYDLLEYMEQCHGISCLINTSFNGKGEPIVHTEKEAMASAQKMELDAVIVNGRLILLAGNCLSGRNSADD